MAKLFVFRYMYCLLHLQFMLFSVKVKLYFTKTGPAHSQIKHQQLLILVFITTCCEVNIACIGYNMSSEKKHSLKDELVNSQGNCWKYNVLEWNEQLPGLCWLKWAQAPPLLFPSSAFSLSLFSYPFYLLYFLTFTKLILFLSNWIPLCQGTFNQGCHSLSKSLCRELETVDS